MCLPLPQARCRKHRLDVAMKARPTVPALPRIHFDLTTVRLFIATAVSRGAAGTIRMLPEALRACRMGATHRARTPIRI